MVLEMKEVRVYWVDACWESGTYDLESLAAIKPIEMITRGLLVAEVNDCYYLATDEMPLDKCYRHIHLIPKNYVSRVEILHDAQNKE